MTTSLSKNKKVQVVCLAYNQVEFIRDALNGFVMQKTNFPFEVLVGDDCSTDGTSEIIAEYAKKYPHIITHIRREQNMGAQENSFDLLNRVDADYLALCEGDDYWTNPNKLQMQVDLLEKNKHLNGCFHNVLIKKFRVKKWYGDIAHKKNFFGRQFWPNGLLNFYVKKEYSLKDVLSGIIATSSVMYRWKNFKLPNFFEKVIYGDRTLNSIICANGTFGYINKTMSVYRVSKKGIAYHTSYEEMIEENSKKELEMFQNLDKYFDYRFHKLFLREEAQRFIYILLQLATKNDKSELVKFIDENYEIYHFILTKKELKRKIYHKIFGLTYLKIKIKSNIKIYYILGFIPLFFTRGDYDE